MCFSFLYSHLLLWECVVVDEFWIVIVVMIRAILGLSMVEECVVAGKRIVRYECD